MKISQNGLNLIKSFEGCKLVAYLDSVGRVTIGYGMTNAVSSIIGYTIKLGMKITQAQADSDFEKVINVKYAPSVDKYNSVYHFNQNQFDALTSFAYNIGSIGGLTANGTRSIAQISDKISAYCTAGGKTLTGLVRRRTAEKKLFDTPVATSTKTAITTSTKQTSNPNAGQVIYCAHVQDIGWQPVVSDGSTAGTTGQNKQIEALKIYCGGCPMSAQAHVSDIGWMDVVNGTGDTIEIGTTGQNKGMECVKLFCPTKALVYRVHVQDIGWMDWVWNGAEAGTTGQNKHIEAIEIKFN